MEGWRRDPAIGSIGSGYNHLMRGNRAVSSHEARDQVKKMKLTIVTCRGALARLYEYLDGELSSADARAVKLHLKICRECSKRFRFEEQLLERVREKSQMARLPEELRQRIEATLDGL